MKKSALAYRTHQRTVRLATIAITAGAFAVPLIAATPASAAAPAVTASASDNLTNGQQIMVSGTGYAANATIGIVECSTAAPNPANPAADCDLAHAVLTQAAADGSFPSTAFTVTTGAIGSNGNFCPSKVAGGGCYLVASNTQDTTNAAETPLTFAPVISVTPSSNVKSGQKVSVSGYGFPASKPAYVTSCASPPSASTCNTANVAQTTTDANGILGTVMVTVVTGTWGGKSCVAGGTCLMTATTDITGTLPDQSAVAPFTFASVTRVATAIFRHAAVKNGKVKISGSIKAAGVGVSRLRLTLFDRAKGTKRWHKVTTGKSAAHGAFAFRGLKHFHHAEQYRVTHPRQQIGNTIFKASISKTVTVR